LNFRLLRSILKLWIDVMLSAVGGFCVTTIISYYYLRNRSNLTRTRSALLPRGLECRRRWLLLEINRIIFSRIIYKLYHIKISLLLYSWTQKAAVINALNVRYNQYRKSRSLSTTCIPGTLFLFIFFILKLSQHFLNIFV